MVSRLGQCILNLEPLMALHFSSLKAMIAVHVQVWNQRVLFEIKFETTVDFAFSKSGSSV